MSLLDREEYVEQGYFFQMLIERLPQNLATQDLLESIRLEVLATTKLPMALDYLSAELRHNGVFAPAMRQMSHYFTPFQTYVIAEAEEAQGRFDFRMALQILLRQAEYLAKEPTPQGMFLYQFESLCRNRLRYDPCLEAMAADPIYDASWRDWIESLRRRVGMVDLADLIYVRSAYYSQSQTPKGKAAVSSELPELFGEREGRIALANRRKDPLYLFSALHRQLGYPVVPRPKLTEETEPLLPQLSRRVERLEGRLKLMEEERRGGVDLSQFYKPPDPED